MDETLARPGMDRLLVRLDQLPLRSVVLLVAFLMDELRVRLGVAAGSHPVEVSSQ